MKKTLSLALVFGIIISTCSGSIPAKAATIKLNKKTLTLTAGSSYTLKVKGTKAKVKWTSKKKSVATVSSKGKVTAKKTGSTTITAKVKGKKYTCKVTGKTKPSQKAGSKSNPISAYKKNTFTFYEEGKKKGKFTFQLLKFASGDEASELALNNSANLAPTDNQEYIYFKFRIKYISGTQTIKAKDIFNYYYNIYGNNSSIQINNIDWGFFFENVDDLGTTLLSPGNDVTCAKAVLVTKGYSPITYRIQTGKNSYTWFTTEK